MKKLPQPIQEIPTSACQSLQGLLTDIDDTLTTDGKLLACAYEALERARAAGLTVVVVTGRPAGWVDHIARMWPVDGVIGENGAFYFWMEKGKLRSRFLQGEAKRRHYRKRLERLARKILIQVPGTALASDQGYRACDLAIDYCEDVRPLGDKEVQQIVEIFRQHRASVKVSSIHVNGWFGRYDKLGMCRRFFREVKGMDLDQNQEHFIFVGDSPNDEPLFAFFTHGIGVANVKRFLKQMEHAPHWITRERGSQGFAETIATILKKRFIRN